MNALRPQNRVLFVQVTNPAAYPPLINASQLFAERGWEATFLSSCTTGTSLALDHHPNIHEHAAPPRADFKVSALAWADYCRRAVRLAQRLRPQLVYASDPIGALPGLLAARSCGAKLIYHEHDSPNRHADLNLAFRLSRKAATRASLRVIFPNAERAAAAQAELGFDQRALRIVWNMPRLSELPAYANRGERPLVVYYHGTINPERLPPSVAQAVARLGGQARLRILGYETASGRGYIDSLRAQFGDAAQGGVIEHLGQVDRRQQLFDATAAAHVGLALMPLQSRDINMRHMTGASNKAFDYMACGLPLLVSDMPDWNALFVAGGYGKSCNPQDPDGLERALRWFLENPEERSAIAANSRRKIEADWNFDKAFAPIVAALT